MIGVVCLKDFKLPYMLFLLSLWLDMKRIVQHSITKWVLFGIFLSYTACVSMFTHTHVINHNTYVHSHPFKKNEPTQHTHTQQQLVFLQVLFQQLLTDNVVTPVVVPQPHVVVLKTNVFSVEEPLVLWSGDNTQLRAPPAAA